MVTYVGQKRVPSGKSSGYSHRGAGSLKLGKKLESQNEIMIASTNKSDNEFANIATSLYYQKRQQPHAEIEKF